MAIKQPTHIREIQETLRSLQGPHTLRMWSEEIRLELDWQVYEYLKRRTKQADMPKFLNRKKLEDPDLSLRLKLEDPEKDFTEIYLAQLLDNPGYADVYSEILQNLGHAIEEHTILEVQWMLERDAKKHKDGGVSTQLQGFKNYFKLEQGEARVRATFEVELALATLTLSCLSRNKKMQLDFVKSLLIQLKQISELLSDASGKKNGSDNRHSGGRSEAPTDSGSVKIAGEHRNAGARTSENETPTKNNGPIQRQISGTLSGQASDQAAPEVDDKSGLKIALWLRLHLLMPLLPIIYRNKPERNTGSGDSRSQSMREQLSRICLRLLGCPLLQEGVSFGKVSLSSYVNGSDGTEVQAECTHGEEKGAGSCSTPRRLDKFSNGEGLFNVVSSIFHAVLGMPAPLSVAPL